MAASYNNLPSKIKFISDKIKYIENLSLTRWAQSDSKSLKFAIYLVQRSSAALAPNFKMAASFSVEEVLQVVVRDEEMEIDDDVEANEEVTLADRIKEYPKEVGSGSIDIDFFVDAGVSMLLPLYDLSQRRVEGLPAEACQILNTIMRSESSHSQTSCSTT